MGTTFHHIKGKDRWDTEARARATANRWLERVRREVE